jgi:ornithine cyclodeaminase
MKMIESSQNNGSFPIYTDEDVDRWLPMPVAIEAIRKAFLAKYQGHLPALTRFSFGNDSGSLVFTPGEETENTKAIGFRLYDTFRNDLPGHTQMVIVFDSQTGVLKGLVLGNLLGGLRTAVINAVAIHEMSRRDVKTMGVLGSGFQASLHIQAAVAVRDFERAVIFSPNQEHRQALAEAMTTKLGIAIDALDSAQDVVRQSDVLICASRSSSPIFHAEWLKPGTHINTIGPKTRDAHELPLDAARLSKVIATDTLAQVEAYQGEFFLDGTPDRPRMVELDKIVAGEITGRDSPQDITLFCSSGLAGTEVVLANTLIELASNEH